MYLGITVNENHDPKKEILSHGGSQKNVHFNEGLVHQLGSKSDTAHAHAALANAALFRVLSYYTAPRAGPLVHY